MLKLPKIPLLIWCLLNFCFIKNGYADSPLTPLWTPEDTVTVPVVITQDVSSDGKYTLVTLQRTSLTDGSATQSSDCVLINNKNLEIKTINKIDQSCMQLQFIGEGKKFSYIFYNDKDKKSALFVHDIPSHQTVQVQEFKEGFYN